MATNLPKPLVATDAKYPDFKKGDRVVDQFTLYNTARMGWCITTLGISNGRRGNTARTYAVRISDGALCRVGNGPHVLQVVTIYVRESRKAALQSLLDLREKGAADAGTVRDRISSRRAEGALNRAKGMQSWRWSV